MRNSLRRRTLSSPQSTLACAHAKCIHSTRNHHNHREDGPELRRGTRSIWERRRYPSRRQRMLPRTCYGNRVRIRPRRWRDQCWERWQKEPRSKKFSSHRCPPFRPKATPNRRLRFCRAPHLAGRTGAASAGFIGFETLATRELRHSIYRRIQIRAPAALEHIRPPPSAGKPGGLLARPIAESRLVCLGIASSVLQISHK